jgi:hypothetical protein
MEAVGTSETSVYSSETARPYIPEGSNLHTRRRENLRSHIYCLFTFSLINFEVLIQSAGRSFFIHEQKSYRHHTNPISDFQLRCRPLENRSLNVRASDAAHESRTAAQVGRRVMRTAAGHGQGEDVA